MKTRKPVLRVLAMFLAFACIATAADAPKLTFKFKTINVKGSQETDVYANNNAGVMVGEYFDSSGVQHGMILKGTKVTTIEDPNGTDTAGYGINNVGAVVGFYINSLGNGQGFLYYKGKFKDVGTGPVGNGSAAYGNNDKGEIVGTYVDSSNVQHGFLKKGKKYTTLDYPGATFTIAHSINNSGLITIIWGDSSGNEEGALYDGKEYTLINVPGAVSSYPHKIDTAGDIVYSWADSNGNFHGELCTNCASNSRTFYTVDDPKGAQARANGINDHRTIVGRFIPSGNTTFEGFKATY
jgi:uncharacterized membrane protein